MAPKKQVGVSGKVYTSQSREIIGNVLKFMKKEALQRGPVIPLANFKKRVMEATGISDKIYREVVKDLILVESGQAENFRNPERSRQNKYNVQIKTKQSGCVEEKTLEYFKSHVTEMKDSVRVIIIE